MKILKFLGIIYSKTVIDNTIDCVNLISSQLVVKIGKRSLALSFDKKFIMVQYRVMTTKYSFLKEF